MNKHKELTKTDENVLEVLKASLKDGLTKEAIQMSVFEKVGPNWERRIRASIKNLRDHGYVIASSSDKPGYRLTADKDDVKHYVNETRKRAKMLLATARKVEKSYGLRNNMSMRLTS